MQLFGTKGQISSLSRDKGTMGQAQNLALGQAGTACQNTGREEGRDNHYFAFKIQERTRDGTITILLSKSGTGCGM